MPSKRPVPLAVIVRPAGRAPFRAVSLDDLTNVLRIYRKQMAISRDDLKKKRLQAMGVVGTQMAATDKMYDRIITAGAALEPARAAAETAHMGALAEQAADLQEMAEELGEFAQAVPSNGGGAGTAPPAKASATPSAGAAALAALNAAQPNPPREWKPEGDAYVGTKPPE